MFNDEVTSICRIIISNATTLDKCRQVAKGSPCLFMYMSFLVVGDFHNIAKIANFSRGPSCPLICVGLQVVVGDFDQFVIFSRFAKFAGFTRGPSSLLISIGLQVVVGDFDQFAIFARFAGFTRGPSCLLICIGLQVVVGEILPFLPFLLLCAFLDISPKMELLSEEWKKRHPQGGRFLPYFTKYKAEEIKKP